MHFLDLKQEYASIKKEIGTAIAHILQDGVFIGGSQVENFEKKFALYCGSTCTIGVNSGTDALFLALKALGIGEGHEVITTPFTFFATAEAIANTGARVVFVDIDPHTFNIDPTKIEASITKKTKAILPVHLYGALAEMKKIGAIAKRHRVHIIEDAAQAIGAMSGSKKAGTFGNLGCFSFFPSKNLGSYGDGGMITTNSPALARTLRLLKNHGSSPRDKYKNLILGTNSRLDALQAAILSVKLRHLETWNTKRRNLARFYNESLRDVSTIQLPKPFEQKSHVWHQYTIQCEKRDGLKNFLGSRKIPTMIYYPLALHLQPALKFLGYKRGDFPVTEQTAKKVLSLPIHPFLKKHEVESVVQAIREFYKMPNESESIEKLFSRPPVSSPRRRKSSK